MYTHTHTNQERLWICRRAKEDRLLAFKSQKVLMLSIDWYLSSVRWGERMHNHNYRWVRSLICSGFIFVDAFHLYSLVLWTQKRRFPSTRKRRRVSLSPLSSPADRPASIPPAVSKGKWTCPFVMLNNSGVQFGKQLCHPRTTTNFDGEGSQYCAFSSFKEVSS